jgi:hypothetical protein
MKQSELRPVTSSNIEAVGHEPKTNTLFVLFKQGGYYSYQPVTDVGYSQLLSAESPGKYLHQNIKGNDSISCAKLN